MARTDNLSNFLTDVADAIRTKTGGTEKIQASQFDKEIENISSGDELIAEYEITNSTTTNVVFDNLNVANDEVCYVKVTGHNAIMGMSVNELIGSGVAKGTQVDAIDGGTTSQANSTYVTSYGMVGCLRNQGTIFIHKTSTGVLAAGFGVQGYVTVAGFDLTDEILTKITLYAKYSSITTAFANGTKIQLYKQATV